MPYLHNKSLVHNARELRKNMTKEERHLWYDFLRNINPKFYRQRVIGNYVVDFYCAKAKLVIELDGSQHYENDAVEYDRERTAFLKQNGIKVVRIPNNEINDNFDGVCVYISKIVSPF